MAAEARPQDFSTPAVAVTSSTKAGGSFAALCGFFTVAGVWQVGCVKTLSLDLVARAECETLWWMTTAGLDIAEMQRSDLDDLEPLWNALREHHLAIGADWLPSEYSRDESWRRRRAEYEDWLGSSEGFVLVARRALRPVGYAVVHLRGGSATWRLAARTGEVETLSVLPAERDRGTGRRLLFAISERLRMIGVEEMSLHVLTTNVDAISFYERQGFKPFAVSMTRSVPNGS